MTVTISSGTSQKRSSGNRISLADDLARSHISSSTNTNSTGGTALPTSAAAESEKDAGTVVTTAESEKDDTAITTANIPCSLEMRDNCYFLPKCELPPRKQFAPVERFVASAIQSKLELTGDDNAQKAYQAVMDAIRRKRDLAMLQQIFLALRTADNGLTLHQLSSNPSTHAQLLHFLLRFDPFGAQRVDTHKGQVIPNKIDDINATDAGKAKDDGLTSAYSLADAYFHLILALVSANSVFLVPTMVCII